MLSRARAYTAILFVLPVVPILRILGFSRKTNFASDLRASWQPPGGSVSSHDYPFNDIEIQNVTHLPSFGDIAKVVANVSYVFWDPNEVGKSTF